MTYKAHTFSIAASIKQKETIFCSNQKVDTWRYAM